MKKCICMFLIVDTKKTKIDKIKSLTFNLIEDIFKLKEISKINSKITRSLLSDLGKSYFFIENEKIMFKEFNKETREVLLTEAVNIMSNDIIQNLNFKCPSCTEAKI